MGGLQAHLDVVNEAMERDGLEWAQWPDLVASAPFSREERLSAVLVLLSHAPTDTGPSLIMIPIEDIASGALDDLGRARRPWVDLARMSHPWDAGTARLALDLVSSRRPLDERRVAIAVRGAEMVCRAGRADADLLDAVDGCVRWLDSFEESGVVQLQERLRRAHAAATPPDLLDLSLIVDGDRWARAAREAARASPPDEISPLLRLLGQLGPRKPSARWLRQAGQALTPAATQLLREWLEIAARADAVPAPPCTDLGEGPSTLLVGTNRDLVAATARATVLLPDAAWAPPVLTTLAARGAAHNGVPDFPEALALKVASASVDALLARRTAADLAALSLLRTRVTRRDLLARIGATLDDDASAAGSGGGWGFEPLRAVDPTRFPTLGAGIPGRSPTFAERGTGVDDQL